MVQIYKIASLGRSGMGNPETCQFVFLPSPLCQPILHPPLCLLLPLLSFSLSLTHVLSSEVSPQDLVLKPCHFESLSLSLQALRNHGVGMHIIIGYKGRELTAKNDLHLYVSNVLNC